MFPFIVIRFKLYLLVVSEINSSACGMESCSGCRELSAVDQVRQVYSVQHVE